MSEKEKYAIYCKRTGEEIARVQYQENSGSCECLSRDRCERPKTATIAKAGGKE
jgi:hypothetical protein